MDNGGILIWEFMEQFEKAGQHHAPTRVLILEDDLCLKTVITGLLQSIEPGMVIDWMASSDPVMAALGFDRRALHQYDLVFADIFLEGTSTGLDLWRHCRQYCPGVRILLTSTLGLDRLEGVLGTEELGHAHFLSKPFALDDCRAKLEMLLNY